MKILTIKRSKWITGSQWNSYLLRPKDQKMCCLGFLAIKRGASKEDILGQKDPSYTAGNVSWPKKLYARDTCYMTDLCSEMITVNDGRMPNDRREEKLRGLFRKIGITLRFVD